MQSYSNNWYYPVYLFCFLLIPPAYTEDISFGGIYRYNDEEELEIAVRTAQSKNGGNNDTFDLADRPNWKNSRLWEIKKLDAFTIGKTACTLINRGRKILLATGNWKTHSTLNATSLTYNWPFVNWASAPHGNGRYEISMYPPTYYAIADLVIRKKWDRLIYVFDTESGAWNQRALVDYLQLERNRSIAVESVHLPSYRPNESTIDYFRFFLDFHHRYFAGSHRVILDVEREETLKKVLFDLQDVAMKTSNFHYVIASYDVTWSELDPFRNGLMNVTIFQLLEEQSEMFQRVQNIIRRGTQEEMRKVDKEVKTKRLSARTCLAYDSVLVLAAAILEVEKKERYRYSVAKQQSKKAPYCQIDDDVDRPPNAEGNTQEFASLYSQAIKGVKTSGLTGQIEFDEHGIRRNYELKLAELEFRTTLDGPVGILTNTTWAEGYGFLGNFGDDDLATAGQIKDLLNKTLKITTVLVDPFVMKSKDYYKYEHVDHTPKTPKFEGYIIDLIDLLSKKMDKFDYVIRPRADGAFGSPDSGGLWNGMIGELITDPGKCEPKSDMAIGPVTITRQRERVVAFSKPFMTTGISIMIKKPDKQEFSVFSFLQPLSGEVWMYIIFAYVGVSVVIFLISRFSPYEWRVEEGAHGVYTITNDFSIYNCLWFTLAAFMQQGTDILPRSVSGRIASSAWWFFTMIIVSSYTANLAAFLTMEKMTPPIDSVDALVKQTKIKYGIQRSGSTEAFFRDSPLQVHKRMSQFMETHKHDVMVKDYAEGIAKVRESKHTYAFLLEATANEYASTRKPCDTMKVAGENLNSLGYGVATPFCSPLRNRINLAILELQENGELKRLQNKWWYEKAQCEQGMADSQSASLTLSKVAGIFYILLGGMVFAMCAAFGEFFHRSRKQAKKNREGSITCRRAGSMTKLTDPTVIDKSWTPTTST